jgi:hypothetical protein
VEFCYKGGDMEHPTMVRLISAVASEIKILIGDGQNVGEYLFEKIY